MTLTFFELLSLVFSISALLVAIFSWRKNRAIYGVEIENFFPEKVRKNGNSNILEKLKTGNYNILHSDYRASQYYVLLGRLKREKE